MQRDEPDRPPVSDAEVEGKNTLRRTGAAAAGNSLQEASRENRGKRTNQPVPGESCPLGVNLIFGALSLLGRMQFQPVFST